MALHKVSELEGALLDAAVALAEGFEHPGAVGVNHRTDDGTPWCLSGCNDWWRSPEGRVLCGPCQGYPRQYSEDWSAAGPIIDRERISVEDGLGDWSAATTCGCIANGPTFLVAAMRAYVASKFGDEVEL